MVLQEMKLIAEEYLGEPVAEGGRHRPRVLQRQPAPGDQGRRRGSPASTSSASSTSRPPPRSPTASARTSSARSPSTTSAAARSTSRSSRSATASSRSSRPRATRSSAARTSTRASSTGSCTASRSSTTSTCARTGWRCSASRTPPRRRSASCRAVKETEINLPFIISTRPQRGAAPAAHADARQARGADRATSIERTVEICEQTLEDAELEKRRDRRRDPRRRHDAHAARPAGGRRVLRPRAVQGRAPRRGRRARRGDPGRGAHRREAAR